MRFGIELWEPSSVVEEPPQPDVSPSVFTRYACEYTRPGCCEQIGRSESKQPKPLRNINLTVLLLRRGISSRRTTEPPGFHKEDTVK